MTIKEGPADALNGRVGSAAIQKDLAMPEECANRSIKKFSKDKRKVLHLRGNYTLQQQNRHGTYRLRNISAEKDLGLQVNSKLSMSVRCSHSKENQQHSGLYQQMHKGCDHPPSPGTF